MATSTTTTSSPGKKRKASIEEKEVVGSLPEAIIATPKKKARKNNNYPLLKNYEQETRWFSTKELRLLNEILEGKKDNYFLVPKFYTSNELRLLLLSIATKKITPGIVAYVSAGCLFDTLYDNIYDDKTFLLLSLLVGINNGFFSKSYDIDDVYATELVEKNGPSSSLSATTEDFIKIKRRWRMLDTLTAAVTVDKLAGSDASVNRLVNVVAYFIRKRLFKKLIKLFDSYSESDEYYIGNGGSPMQQQPFDISFSLPMIDRANFNTVSKLVKRNVLTFFNPVYRRHYRNEEQVWSKRIKGRSGLGVCWKHSQRNCTLRNFMINKVMELCHQDNEIEEERRDSLQSIEERVQSFEDFMKRLDYVQCLDVITHWRFPYSLLMNILKNSLEQLRKQGRFCYFDICAVAPLWNGKCFGLLVERVMTENKSGVSDYLFDESMKMIIKLNCIESFTAIVEKYGEMFSICRIKEYTRYIVSSEVFGHVDLLKVLLKKSPWLLKTWLDHKGNTMLGLCVIHDYPYFRALMSVSSVKKYVNVESMDGLTPLLLAADYPKKYHMINDLIEGGLANPIYVNRHSESILHRLAASNNFKGLQFFIRHPLKQLIKNTVLELRRKGDGATALMLALARENVDVAYLMMRSLGAMATTKFGNSKTLRTAEAIFLKQKNISVALLAEMGIHPESKIIADSFKVGALFQEECFVAMTGVENNSRVCDIVFRGEISHRLKKNVGVKWKESALNNQYQKENSSRMSVCLDDLSWTLFNNHQSCKRLKWATHLLSNNGEELNKVIRDSVKIFGDQQECPICLDDFSEDQKGLTRCGHSFHLVCWARVEEERGCMKKCPVCRTNTTLQENSEFSPEPVVVVITKVSPETEIRKYRRKREEEEEGLRIYNKIARYEFFVDGKWVDESSLSCII
uniref:Wsv064-like protein n=1 Tax=Sesarmops intermedium nimavirus TaxID=2133796 RepID=A0A401IPM7_9VIRU|nr:MAG: wsv064-like protein [Sesarmops intermedium nimavirus]GBG35562.1 wsv064-like protein [Sesarmops intermedium nimavirus]